MKTVTKVGLGVAAFLLPGALLLAALGYAVYYVKKKSDASKGALPEGSPPPAGVFSGPNLFGQNLFAAPVSVDAAGSLPSPVLVPAPPPPAPAANRPAPASFAARNMLAPDLQRKSSAAKAASLLADELPSSAISSFVLPKGTYSWSDGATFNAKKLTLTNHSGHSVQLKTPKGPFTLENDTQYALALDSALYVPNPN